MACVTKLHRRRALTLLGGLLLAPTLVAAASRTMSAVEAHKAAGQGDILLLDIRTRGEWRQTGIGASAHPVSMHERSFLQKLQDLTGGDKSKAIALICATGGRSNYLQGALQRIGYSNVIDVSEGMIGNGKAPGWIRAGLPVKAFGQ